MTHTTCYPSVATVMTSPLWNAYLEEANNRWQQGPAWYLIDKATGRQIASFSHYAPACIYLNKHHRTDRPSSLQSARRQTDETDHREPPTPAPKPRPVQWGSQGDSAHTPKGGNEE